MNILLFDMDGVLLKANGYHLALQETVRLAGLSLGYTDIHLTTEHISRLEGLGISSEWHSSAMCMAVLAIQKEINPQEMDWDLDLEVLFDLLSKQSMKEPGLKRACKAIEEIASNMGVSPKQHVELVKASVSIKDSATMNWFQELVLGSEIYSQTYQKAGQFNTESYLNLFDERLLNEANAARIQSYANDPLHGAAIMTNRPSNTLLMESGTPEAEMGASLVGLKEIPLVGYGEIIWLAGEIDGQAGELNKPAWQHAMASILAASGWSVKESLRQVGKPLTQWDQDTLMNLNGSTVTVFEDTPGGFISAREAGNVLDKMDIEMRIQMMGIAVDEHHQRGLTSMGATIYPSVNEALADLECF